MTDTALRAGTQSAHNTHMVFANGEHEKFYYEKLEQAKKGNNIHYRHTRIKYRAGTH